MNAAWSSAWSNKRKALLFATVEDNPWVIQQPTAKQAEFLTSPELEVLFGGAAGPGKSTGLLQAAAQFVEVPRYAALLLRRTYADLAKPGALMDRAKEWWMGRGARWNGTEHKWTFPSGAVVQFGYLEHDDDRLQYQSSEFQFVGFDELTQFTEIQYRYLFSRLRRLVGSEVPIRMRSASNPGGPGHDWVKERFIANPGQRVFIPARLDDNPHLDRAAYLETLAELDPLTRQQLLLGDWDAVAGGRFQRHWFRDFTQAVLGRYDLGTDYRVDASRCWRFLTCDPAASSKETAKKADPDWTVIGAWAVTPKLDLLWLDTRRFRKEIPDIIPELLAMWDAHHPQFCVIEGGGMQKAVYQLACRTRMACREYIPPPGHDKLVRATKGIVLAEAGRLYLPKAAAWREVAESELVRFTGDEKQDSHDDIVDCLSMAAHVMTGKDDERRTGFKPYVLGGA